MQHIEKATGQKIEIIPVSSYAALVLAMRSKKIDFAYMGPKGFVDAMQRAGADALAMEVNEQGQPGYHSIIVTNQKAPKNLKEVKDFKNKSFAYVDLNSTSGGLIPTMYFDTLGIKPKKFFSNVLYTGSHEAAVMSIRNNKVDLAVTNDLDMEELIKNGRLKRDELRVIWTSKLIPGSLYASSGHLKEAMKNKIKNALISFAHKKTLNMMAISTLIKAKNSDYNVIKDIMDEKRKRSK